MSMLSRLTTRVPDALFHREDRPAPDAAGLLLQWLGTAGFRLQHKGFHFWLDPHLSRHRPFELATGRVSPDLQRILAEVDLAHAVAVGHSHYDHAIDTPAIARLHGAQVYGSRDTLQICRGQGVPERQLHELRGWGETFDVGPFTLRAVRSEHSPLALGHVPYPGRITEPFDVPAPLSAYRVGEVFGLHLQASGTSVCHVGSAALIDAELRGLQADVVLCCTIGRHATPRFVHRVIDALRPKLLIPCHWDQFWRPIQATARQIPGNDLEGFLADVARHPQAPQVQVLPLRGWTTLS
jgi:L-ascorbate metabolism protein UlaG (beta-lactamase superfamily)